MSAPRRVTVFALLAAIGASAVAFGEAIAPAGKTDPRVRRIAYDAAQVYRLPAFVGYQIHVELEPGEKFVGLAAGDLEGLSVSSQDHHVFLKPKAPRVATNLTLLTNLRPYQFEYSAVSRRPEPWREDVIYSLRFEYALVTGQPSEASRVDAALVTPIRPRNLAYAYCGPRSLKPISAFDDGVQLHVRFAPGADLPAFFVREADGTESLVNFSVESDSVTVHRLVETLILRRGKQVGCLINRAPLAQAVALDTGTVTPAVQRRVRKVAP
jgi:type IV secretion system protein VirB9